MTPTPELRFVEREIVVKPMTADDPTYTTKIIRILQQKFGVFREGQMCPPYEWRDVPLVKGDV